MKLTCINNKNWLTKYSLTPYKEYEILEEDEYEYRVCNDNYVELFYPKELFDDLSIIHEIKWNGKDELWDIQAGRRYVNIYTSSDFNHISITGYCGMRELDLRFSKSFRTPIEQVNKTLENFNVKLIMEEN